MNCTQNEKISQVSDETMVVGIDVSSETHYARAFDFRGREVGKVFKFCSDAAGFSDFTAWIERVKLSSNKTSVIIGAEPTAEYWFTLAEYLKVSELKFVFVSPMHVKRTKELDDNHPSKTDAKDPKTIAKLVIEGRYLEPYIPEDIYAEGIERYPQPHNTLVCHIFSRIQTGFCRLECAKQHYTFAKRTAAMRHPCFRSRKH